MTSFLQHFPYFKQARDPAMLWWSIGLFLVMLVLAIFHQQVNPWLAWERGPILHGQVWRLVTCHFVHLNVNHLLLDGSGFLLIGFIFQDLLTRKLLFVWAGVSAPVCGLLLFLDPTLQGYVGLSGILHGWLVIALVVGWREHRWLHSLALLLVAAKLIYEHTPFYNAGYLNNLIHGPVYSTAHLYGALIGLVIGLAALYWRRSF